MNRNNIDTPIDSIEYQNCYVAFLDMLGFSNICKNKSMSCSEILTILSFNSIINNSVINAMSNNDVTRYIFPDDITKSVYYSIMSDSIFIATPDNKSGLLYLLQICSIIQYFLLEHKILLRGGITKGEFFGHEDIAFGPALVKAHYIEDNIAVYPRIVLSKEVMDDVQAEKDSILDLQISKSTEDSLYFVDYLNLLYMHRLKKEPERETIIYDFIQEGCLSNNPKIRIKHQWAKNYFEASQKKYNTAFPNEEEIKRITDDFMKFMQERNKGNA